MYISIPLTLLVIVGTIILWNPISKAKKGMAESANMLIESTTDHCRLFRAEDIVDLKKSASELVTKYESLPQAVREKPLNDILATIK